jgi:hypothetical protein
MASISAAAAAAAILAGCGGDDPTEVKRFEPTIAQIHRVTPDFTREVVEVSGTVVPVKDSGFVLRQDGDRIFVNAPPRVVLPLSNGDRVRVVGQVRAITPLLERAIQSRRDVVRDPGEPPHHASKAARRAVAETPSDTGSPYIEADSVEPVSG